MKESHEPHQGLFPPDFAEADAEDLKRPGNRNPRADGRQALDSSAALPDGPFSVGLTKGPRNYTGPPWTVVCGDGRAIAGHVPSKAIAEDIADAMNQAALAAKFGGRYGKLRGIEFADDQA